MALGLDLAELSRHLRQERLFVKSEKEQLQNLYDQVKISAEQLYHQSWISRQMKDLLDSLIQSNDRVKPAECCSLANQLEATTFVDGYKQLSYHDTKYGEFLKFLLENLTLLGQLLCSAEVHNVSNVQEIIKILMHSVFGNCVLHEDETAMLHVLKSLIDAQLAPSDNPRILLRRSSCTFSMAFKQLFDTLFSSKLYLTAALHDPVMQLLMEDEWFYDIDPGKALVRFSAPERLRRFGEPGTAQYKEKLAKYRAVTVDKLVMMANRFITSIKNNMHCFPSSLGWIVSQVYQTLTKSGKVELGEVRAVCTDLVFAFFICPAICDPEPHGITTDVPISHIARHNLMQMAQIIQVLALSQSEEIDNKLHDLYWRFEKGCMSTLLDLLLDGTGVELTSVNLTQLPCLTRTSCLIQLSQLNSLIKFLRASMPFVGDSAEKKILDEILSNLVLVPLTSQTPVQSPNSSLVSCPSTPPGTPSAQRKTKVKKKLVVSMGGKESMVSDETNSISSSTMDTEAEPTNEIEEVLVISLGIDLECPGMMSEQKVLTYDQENKRRRVKYQTIPGEYEVEIQEKRTRFSLSHDQESIGNASDIPEAISEGASSHSVGSQDLENEDDNDNFSDMISANVSGRGTPNISGSGRDTPLSQAESEEVERVTMPPPVLPETVQKKNREDVTDKFGKFEIKQELDYDLKSTVSDTWSTDVLASDSEPPDMTPQVCLVEISEEMVTQHLLATQERVSEISETASDAWSTDVLASDNEEKQDTETFSELDDISSMAEIPSNLDEVRSESDIAEGNEVTPLASGLQTPSESESADLFTVASIEGTSVNSDSISMSPTFSDSAFSDTDFERVSRGSGSVHPSSNLFSNRLFVPIARKRDQPSSPSMSPDRASNMARPPSIRNRLVDFDLEPRLGNLSESKMGSDSEFSNSDSIVSVSNDKITFDAGARPKAKMNDSSKIDKKNARNASTIKYKETYIEIAKTYLVEMDRPTSNDSGISSAQFIDVTDSIDLKMSEQQNANVNEEQFSAVLNLFDPLADSNEMSSCDLLEGTGSPPPSNSFHNFTYQQDDAKPLVIISATQDINKFKFGIALSGVIQNGVGGDESYVVIQNAGQSKQRRSSTDSNRSSCSNLSKEGSGEQSQRASNEIMSSQSVEKDTPTGEQTATPGKKKGLFKTFRDKIHKGIKKKGNKSEKDKYLTPTENTLVGISVPETKETSDDILAKYRKKSILTSTPSSEPVISDRERRFTLKEADELTPLYDPNNLENCQAFLDAKRKLRIVLSSADFQVDYGIFGHTSISYSPRELDVNRANNDLINLLRAQLSEAINLQNKDTVAQLHEVLRCVRQFDNEGCKKLIRSLQADYRNRTSYVSYLVRCKQGLLNTLSHVNRLQNRIKREKEIYNKHMTNVVVKMFLESSERNLMVFITEFQKLTVSDEKTDHVEKILGVLYHNMNRDIIWIAATESQLDDARLAIERYIMSRIYTQAMFPNGDGDIHRDQLFQQHLRELSKIITPDHKDLKIHKMYHLECPWPAAQRELYMINAYKTPTDKVRCVLHCTTTVMNLLSMANEKSVPAADDFTPVFIFVIIKANPPCLLSTIQYVNSFYGARLQGEEHYWWTQFVGAVEFIKTMDYPRETTT